jgi:hypothetical protein
MIAPLYPNSSKVRAALRAAALISILSCLHAGPTDPPPANHGVLDFSKTSAEIRIRNSKDPAKHEFTFKNTSDQPVIIINAESACPPCATVGVDSQIVEAGGTGRVTVNVTPSRRNGHIIARLKTDEDGVQADYELRLDVRRGSGMSNADRAASRLAKRKPVGLAEKSAAGKWELSKTNVWMDARDGENSEIDAKELEAIRKDLPLGETRLSLKEDKSFRMDAGRKWVAGNWSLDGNRIPLKIVRKDCPTCDKTWVLEAVSASDDTMVLDLADEDEGSPVVIRLEFMRVKANR